MENREERLKLLEKSFEQVDALKKRNISSKLEEYVSLGGNGLMGLKKLAMSHEGTDHLMHIFGDILLTVLKLDESKKKSYLDQKIRQFLFSLIEETFSSTKMDSIFLEHQTPPAWIDNIIEDKSWRDLIYRLSEKYKDCLFLKFVVQKISRAGKYHGEISSLTSIATSFDLFKSVIVNQIEELIKLNEREFLKSSVLNNFLKICGFSQYTYMFAQGILTLLSKRNELNGGKYIRLGEELEKHAILATNSSSEMIARKISYLFKENYYLSNVQNSIFKVNEFGMRENVFSEVSLALLSMLTKKSTNPADIHKLYKLYSPGSSGKAPPSVEFLQHRDVFDLLIGDLFNPSRSIVESDKTKYSFLLTLGSVGSSSEEKRQEVSILHKALDKSVALCSSKTASLSLRNTIAKLRKYVHFNIISLGCLEWICCVYCIKTFHLSAYNVENASVCMNFVKEIAYIHPDLRNSILGLIARLFTFKNIDEDITVLVVIEVKRLYLDVLIYLIRLGHVLESLNVFGSFLNEMDLSLIRFFVSQLVGFVKPPFSKEFCEVVNGMILNHERVKKSKLKRNAKCAMFIEQVRKTLEG